MLIRFDEIESVEFQRYAGGQVSTRNFDLCVTLQTTPGDNLAVKEYTFSGIDKTNYTALYTFLSGKKIRIMNIEGVGAAADDQPARGAPLYNEMDAGEEMGESSEDEDYDQAKQGGSAESSSESEDDDDLGSVASDDSDLAEHRKSSPGAIPKKKSAEEKEKKSKKSSSSDGEGAKKSSSNKKRKESSSPDKKYFYVPPDADADPTDKDAPTSAEVLQSHIMNIASVKKTSGSIIAEFDKNKGTFLTPRGRYSIELYDSFLRMRGAKYDYKIKYDDISRLFLLPKQDDMHMAFVIALDKPIRQGQQVSLLAWKM